MAAQPGEGMVPPGYGHIRASTADRERTGDVLKAAFAEGRLDQAEYSERLDRLYQARTYGELAALTYDLPAGPFGPAVPPAAGAVVPSFAALPGVPESPAVSRTSDAAVFSLVFGIGAFLTAGLTSPIAVLLGIVGLMRISRTGGRGYTPAIAGIVLGVLAVLIHLT